MQTLNLELPQQRHLAINAKPILAKLDSAVTELMTARHAFSGTCDNRTLILKLADQVRAEAEDLGSVLDVDMDALNSSLAWRDTRTVILGIGREITAAAGLIASDDPATAFPLKRFRQSIRQLVEHVNAFREGNDTRPAITTSVAEVRARWDDVLAMDSPFDAWAPNRLSDACRQLLQATARPIEMEPEPESRPANQLRVQLSDALFDLINSLGLLSHNNSLIDDSLTERRAVIQRVRDLQRTVSQDFREEVTNAAEILEQLRSIESDVVQLRRLEGSTPGPLSRLIADTVPMMERPLVQIRALLAPLTAPPTAPRTGLLGRIVGFGWGNTDEPEVA